MRRIAPYCTVLMALLATSCKVEQTDSAPTKAPGAAPAPDAPAPTPVPPPTTLPPIETGTVAVDPNPTAPEPPPVIPTDLAGITPASGATIAVGGTLAIDLGLAEAPKPTKVLAFKLKRGEAKPPISFPIDANGRFKADLPKPVDELTTLKSFVRADGSIDLVGLAKVEPGAAENSEADIKEYIAFLESQPPSKGPPDGAYVLVSMVETGDLVEEAQSFRYIGLPSGDDNSINLQIGVAKGNLNLGKITGKGDDARAELPLSTEVFDLPAATLTEIAATDNSLKGLKNTYMNPMSAQGGLIEAIPFFTFSAAIEGSRNAFSAPIDVPSSFGIYFRGENVDDGSGGKVLGASICATGTEQSRIPPATILDLEAPAPISVSLGSAAPRSVSVFTNRNASVPNLASFGFQCFEMESVPAAEKTSFFASGAAEDPNRLNWNWSGFGLDNASGLPAGIWKLKINGEVRGNFDLASGYPLDADGKPVIYVPSVRLTVDADGTVQDYQVRFNYWDAAAGKYAPVTDVSALTNVLQDPGFDVDDYSGWPGNGNQRATVMVRFGADGGHGGEGQGCQGNYPPLVANAEGVLSSGLVEACHTDGDGATVKAPFKFSAGTSDANAVLAIGGMAVSYTLYGNNYRFDLRPTGSN